MTPGSYEGTRKDLNRAIWRLGILEWVILFVAATFALAGGWLTALVLESRLPFRPTWTVVAILLFGIPGLKVVLGRDPTPIETTEDTSQTAEVDGQR